MPGRHTPKQKRQALHVAASERDRGKAPKEAERIGWATVNARKSTSMVKALSFKPHKMRPRDAIAHADHGMYTVSSQHAVHYTPNSGDPQKLGKFGSRAEAVGHANEHHASIGKSFRLMTIDDLVKEMNPEKVRAYHADAARRTAPDSNRTAHVDKPPPAVADVASRTQNERRGAPRRPKPTIRMKPISNDEAMTHLRSGTYNPASQKSLRWLSALKALATGYGKTSGGGALKAANRGRSLPLLGPSGRAAGKSGGHYRKRRLSGKPNFGPDGRPGPRDNAARFGKAERLSFKEEDDMPHIDHPRGWVSHAKTSHGSYQLEEPGMVTGKHARLTYRAHDGSGHETTHPSTKDAKQFAYQHHMAKIGKDSHGPQATTTYVRQFGAKNTVKGFDMTAKVDFNDLFKSELGSDHLVDCPHCEAPITKSDLAKSHKGKGAVTHLSGPKHGKSSAHVRDHNPEGGITRGGSGHGVHTSSRGVPGAKKHDEPVGVQNSKGSRTRKSSVNDDSSSDSGSDGVDKSTAAPEAAQPAAPATIKKSITVRGTPWVQYVDDGSDAAIAKSISEGTLGGTQPTRPLDLNNDLTRLLI